MPTTAMARLTTVPTSETGYSQCGGCGCNQLNQPTPKRPPMTAQIAADLMRSIEVVPGRPPDVISGRYPYPGRPNRPSGKLLEHPVDPTREPPRVAVTQGRQEQRRRHRLVADRTLPAPDGGGADRGVGAVSGAGPRPARGRGPALELQADLGCGRCHSGQFGPYERTGRAARCVCVHHPGGQRTPPMGQRNSTSKRVESR